MLTVAGGKLTTYRRIAYSTPSSTSQPRWGSPGSTGGRCRCRAQRMRATSPRASSRGWELEPAVAAHLAHFYGSRADRVVALAADRPDLLERLHPDAPDIGAQVVFAAREEWATGAD